MTKPLEFHPIANRYPLMEEPEFLLFVEHMREKGFDPRNKIILHEGKILDGRNRYKACVALGIPVDSLTEEWQGAWSSPEEFCKKVNRFRCHYSAGQIALLAAQEHDTGQARQAGEEKQGVSDRNQSDPVGEIAEGEKGVSDRQTPKSVGKIAEENKISDTTLHRAKRILKGATESVKALVVSDTVSVSDAAKVCQLPKEVQDEAARKVSAGECQTLAEAVQGDAWEAEPEPPPAQRRPAPSGATPAPHPRQDGVDIDLAGNAIPTHLRGIFATTLFNNYLDHLHELKKATQILLSESPWWLLAAETTLQLEQMQKRLKNAMPYAICPECDGAKTGCDLCRNQGWVPGWRFDEMKYHR